MIKLEITESGAVNYYNPDTGEGFCLVPKTRNSDGTYSDTDLDQYEFLSDANKIEITSAWTTKIKNDWEKAVKKGLPVPIELLRTKRDTLLSESDWWAMSDLTMTADQTAYRKALRDLPSTASPELDADVQLTNVTWPTKPE